MYTMIEELMQVVNYFHHFTIVRKENSLSSALVLNVLMPVFNQFIISLHFFVLLEFYPHCTLFICKNIFIIKFNQKVICYIKMKG